MPFTIKTTFSFAGIEQGWAEDFYWIQSSTDLNLAEAAVLPLAQKRAGLLAEGYVLTVIRNAVVISDTNTRIKRRTDLVEPRIPGVTGWKPSQPNTALMALWQTADNTQNKKQYMRGVPADLGESGKTPTLTMPGWLTKWNNWRSAMELFRAGWLVTAVDQHAVITSYTISETSGIVTFNLAAPGLTFPLGPGFRQRVYVSLPGKSPLDGPITVIPALAPDGQIKCTTAEPIGVAPFEPGQFGTMDIKAASLVTLAPVGQGISGQIHPQRMVTHKTGRPTYASRGRSPAKPKW